MAASGLEESHPRDGSTGSWSSAKNAGVQSQLAHFCKCNTLCLNLWTPWLVALDCYSCTWHSFTMFKVTPKCSTLSCVLNCFEVWVCQSTESTCSPALSSELVPVCIHQPNTSVCKRRTTVANVSDFTVTWLRLEPSKCILDSAHYIHELGVGIEYGAFAKISE